MTEIINHYSPAFRGNVKKTRVSCRGILIKDNKILLSHEVNGDVYMSPGGGVEEGESFEECCIRELQEETGYIVKPLNHIFTVNEYIFDELFVSQYFTCEIIGTGEISLTETEIDHGITPEWVELSEATNIFGKYKEKTPDKESLYFREFTVINKYKEMVGLV